MSKETLALLNVEIIGQLSIDISHLSFGKFGN
jgi:hypothetical protein